MKTIPVKTLKNTLGPTLYTKLKRIDKLNPKYIMFVANYITNGFNGTEAYMKSVARKGTKPGGVTQDVNRLLENPSIKQAIQIVIDEWLGEKKLKLEKQIIETLTARAFYDINMFIHQDGSPKFSKIEDVPEQWRCVIDGIESKAYGKDANVVKIVLKLADRERAIEKLSKYIELYKESEKQELLMTDETAKRLASIFRPSTQSQIPDSVKESSQPEEG